MNYTQNYHLGLPIPAERYDVSIVNANNTVIDGQMKTNANAINSHVNNVNNPHGVTAAQVGLGNVNNTADSAKPVSTPQSQYIASAVAAEATRATNAEGALSDRITTTAGEVSAEVTRAQGAESDLRDYVDEKLSVTYKASGSVFFADLPALAASREGHVYNIKDDFTTTADFVEGAGKDYPAGTNVVIIEKDEESYEAATVEEGDNPSEMGLYELDGTDYVLTEDTAPIEGKTYYELVVAPAYYYDVLAGFIDTSDFITNTDYATTQAAGIVKPDGTTITINNGVISSQGGGGDVSSEEMADVVNILGAKNLIPSKTFRVNVGGMSAVRSENGSIRVYGTSTETEGKFLIESFLSKGTYTIKTSRTNEQDTGVCIIVGEEHYPGYDEVANSASERGFSNTFTLSSDTNVMYGVHVNSGYTIDETFYFMCYPASIEDDSIVPYAKTNRELTSDVEDIQNQQAETKDALTTDMSSIYSWGVGNLIPPTAKTQTIDGVTFTVNSDRSITVNGTATDDLEYNIADFEIENGDYIFNGYPNGDLPDDPEFDFMCNGHSGCADGSTIQIRHNNASVYIYMEEGSTASNLVFYPMLRPISRTDDTYVPYAKTNRQLTEDIANIADPSEEISDIVNILGAKNLNSYPYTDFTHYMFDTGMPNRAIYYGECVRNGINFSIMEDKTIKIHTDSPAEADTVFAIHSSEPDFCGLTLDNGNYILNGCPSGGSESTFKLYVDSVQNGAHVSYGSDVGSGLSFTLNGDDYSQNKVQLGVYIFIAAGTRFVEDVYFKPMIRPADITNDEYVPYTKTNNKLMAEDNSSNDNSSAENLIDFTMASTHPFFPGRELRNNGVYVKWLNDGSIELNGTSTSDSTLMIGVAEVPPYTLCALDGVGGYNNNCYLYATATTDLNLKPINNWAYFKATTAYKYGYNMFMNNADESVKVYVSLAYTTGQTFDHYVINPALRPVYSLNESYCPYSKTNYQLAEGLNSTIPMLNVLGSKNLLQYPYSETTVTKGQITFTDLGDGTIRVSKSSSGAESCYFWLMSPIPINDFKKMFSHCHILSAKFPTQQGMTISVSGYSDPDGQDERHVIASVNYQSPEALINMDIGYSSLNVLYVGCRLNVSLSSTATTLIKPMIRPYGIKDNTYVPYSKTNYQLTEEIKGKLSDYSTDSSSWDTTPTQASIKPVTSGGVYSALPTTMDGATSSADGSGGLVPAPLIADRTKFLKGDGTWSDVGHDSLSDLTNVTITSPSDGQVLKYNATSGKWVNGDGVVTTFADLSDVDLTSLTDGQLVRYDATNQKWVNFGIDTVPTQNSTKPVSSGGAYTEIAKKQPTYANDAAAWDTVPTASSNNPVTSGGIYNSERDIYNVIGESGAVNMLPNNATTVETNGVTFTVNEDGSITANGTATDYAKVIVARAGGASFYDEHIGKTLKLSGCPSGGAANKYKLRFFSASGIAVDDFGEGVTFTPDVTYSESWYIEAAVSSGATVSNITFYPMVTVPSYNGDYVPYAKNNKQLTTDVLTLYDNFAVNGAINMLPNKAVTTVVNGITFTVNDDGSVIANGTATAYAAIRLANFKDATFYKENIGKPLKLSGSPPGGSLSRGHKIRFNYQDGNFVDDYGEGVIIIPDETYSSTWFVQISISNGITVSNLKFYPMITVPSYEGEYVPYVKSNSQLAKDIENIAGEPEAISTIVNVLGSKNICQNTAATQIVNGITYTVNSDKTVTANGTVTSGQPHSYLDLGSEIVLRKEVTYKITGCPSGGGFQTAYMFYLYNSSRSLYDEGNGIEYTPSADEAFSARIIVYSAAGTVSNLLFKPMICPKSIADDTYVPYAMTNRDLTDNRSYVGMVIHSTTLNTMAKVKAFYGGTTWIQHSGYFLRGATSGVTANSAASTGGADTVTLTVQQIPSHTHTQNAHNHVIRARLKNGSGTEPAGYYGIPYGGTLGQQFNMTANVTNLGEAQPVSALNTTATNQNTGGGQAHNNVPLYKSVYIWERTV